MYSNERSIKWFCIGLIFWKQLRSKTLALTIRKLLTSYLKFGSTAIYIFQLQYLYNHYELLLCTIYLTIIVIEHSFHGNLQHKARRSIRWLTLFCPLTGVSGRYENFQDVTCLLNRWQEDVIGHGERYQHISALTWGI